MLVLHFLLLGGSTGWAQTGAGSTNAEPNYSPSVLPKYTPGTPPPPEAASLGKFGQTPVSLFTGVPSISIPIYTVAVPGASVPISLDYHAGGIRASEQASLVGLGWALQAGGSISSTTYGLADFSANGYITQSPGDQIPTARRITPKLENDLNRKTNADYDYAMRITGALPATAPGAGGITYSYDSQPDIFHYNLAGRSGQFFHTQEGSAHPMPYAPLVIERLLDGSVILGERGKGYRITDEKGTQYLFDRAEISTTLLSRHDFATGWDLGMGPTYEKPQSAVFHLSQINTVNGEWIRFRYDTLTYRYQDVTSRTRYEKVFGNTCTMRPSTYTESYSKVNSLIVAEITSSTGQRVRFEYSSCRRQDLANGRALTAILVDEGETTRRFALRHGYFGPTPSATLCSLPPASTISDGSHDAYRLQLQEVQEMDKPPYRITYLTNWLPGRLAANADHWGFMNGNTGGKFPMDPSKGWFENGFNYSKEPDSVAMVQGLIKELYYPTGGHTRFVFEPNGFRAKGKSVVKEGPNSIAFYSKFTDDRYTDYEDQKEFTVGLKGGNPESFKIEFITPDACNTSTDFFKIQILQAGNPVPVAEYCGTQREMIPVYVVIGLNNNRPLPTGTYFLRIEKKGIISEECYVKLTWNESYEVAPTSKMVGMGGVRIRETLDYDGQQAQPALRKRYYYSPLADTTASSGVTLNNQPTYTTMVDEPQRNAPNDKGTITDVCHFWMQTTNSQRPLSTINGNNMAYTSVLVLSDRQGTQGLTQHRFSFVPDYQPYAGFPFTQPTSHEWERGLPLEETDYVYRADRHFFSPVRRVRTHYTSQFTPPVASSEDMTNYTPPTHPNETHALGLNIALVTPEIYVAGGITNPQYTVAAAFHIEAYKLLSVWHYADVKDEYLFDPLDSTAFRHTRTTYSYANPKHAQLTATATTTTQGERIGTRFAYPLDFDTTVVTTPVAKAIAYLIRTHQLTPTLETQSLRSRNGVDYVVAGELLDYEGRWPRRVRQLQTTTPLAATHTPLASIRQGTVQADSHYRDALWLDRYDDKGRLLTFHRPGKQSATRYTAATDEQGAVLYQAETGEQLASVKNASYQQVASTSFEPGATGRWSYDSTGTHRVLGLGRTGRWAYRLDAQAGVSRANIPAGEYELWYWVQGSTVPTLRVNSAAYTPLQQAVVATAAGGWQQLRLRLHLSALSTLALEGNGILLDELRLHPVGAQMTSYTYVPLIGLSSQTDASGRTTTYEYDVLGRLLRARDEQGRIVVQQEYQYSQQP